MICQVISYFAIHSRVISQALQPNLLQALNSPSPRGLWMGCGLRMATVTCQAILRLCNSLQVRLTQSRFIPLMASSLLESLPPVPPDSCGRGIAMTAEIIVRITRRSMVGTDPDEKCFCCSFYLRIYYFLKSVILMIL